LECQQLYSQYSKDAEFFCNPRFDDRMFVTSRANFNESDWAPQFWKNHEKRTHQSTNQPKKFRFFTKVGFKVAQIPAQILASLRSYFLEGRLKHSRPENMGAFDPNLSGRQSDTWLLDLSPQLRSEVEEAMQPILANWARLPVSDLKLTAIYGVRMYHNGSVLYEHVDREETHVLSAILELEKLALDPVKEALGNEEWPLHILDHAGKKHTVPYQPGQAILYESATCDHGRPELYRGREVASVFVHFAPKGWPENYRNTPGVSRQVHAEL